MTVPGKQYAINAIHRILQFTVHKTCGKVTCFTGSITALAIRSISVSTKSQGLILNWHLKRAANRRVVPKFTCDVVYWLEEYTTLGIGVDLEKCSPKKAVTVESSRTTQLHKFFEKAAKRRKIGPKAAETRTCPRPPRSENENHFPTDLHSRMSKHNF